MNVPVQFKSLMKRTFLLLSLVLGTMITSLNAKAAIHVTEEYPKVIGQFFQFLQAESSDFGVHDALQAFKSGSFTSSQSAVMNFGIGAKPVWLALNVANDHHEPILRQLLLENAWLDKIDVFFFEGDQLVSSFHTGDSLPFSQRPINHRFFVIEHNFNRGDTLVLIRVEADDAMVLPIYFTNTEQLARKDLLNAYSYGLMYGAIVALVAYNLVLYIGLRISSYLLYSIFLLFFIALNLAYTGHGYQWLWPESPYWQRWASAILIAAGTTGGFAFMLQFLDIKQSWPRVNRFIILSCIFFCALVLTAMFMDKLIIALLIAFVFTFCFYVAAVILGIMSLRIGNKFAKYFLIASILTIFGGAITANAVWGVISFNWLTYRAVDIGMTIDAILLALALAARFDINQSEKLAAEKMAGIDLLTSLNNRRSFYKYVKPIWSMSLRSKSSTSVIMLDLDDFKLLNDNYGHALGDQVLVQLAEALQREARSGDILARWGGEEFLIFLPETRLQDAITIAERLRNKISLLQVASSKGEKLTISASFGVVSNQNNHISLDELIAGADQQLYRAKKQGRNCVCSDLSSGSSEKSD